ncbi:MAG: Lrp/AsnC family transcriptional regulator [Chloroflexi bacterium]|nr:Lrp/AsnC family transcriptional regulator [Chloroflexota bacterium]
MAGDLDNLDLRILSEIGLDGRQSASDLARKLGISRTYASKKIQRLLDRKITRIAAFTHPLALGYHTLAVTGVQVSPGELNTVADSLCALPDVNMLIIAAGWQGIVIWTMFANPADLSRFLARELGNISGIKSTETMMVIEWRVSLSYLSSSQWRNMLFSYPPSSYLAPWDNQPEPKSILAQQGDRDSNLSIDQLDLMILKEIEHDGRQPVSDLAKKLGISRANASTRLQRLLDKQITWIVAFTSPLDLGYQTNALIGVRVSPKELDTVMDKVVTLPNVFGVAKVVGRYDVLIGANFPGPTDLSRFLVRELGTISGLLSMEITIGLELRKTSFEYLASSYLQRIAQHQ